MAEVLTDNFLNFLVTVVGSGVVFILKHISDDLRALKDDYKKLLFSKQADNQELKNNINEIKELLRGHYVTKQEFNALRDEVIKLKTLKEGDIKNAVK